MDGFDDKYHQMSELELSTLARTYDKLTDAEQSALRAEFARRGMEAPLLEDEESDSRKLVTVRRYRDLTEAMVARGALESAGIPVYLQDENLIRLDWQLSNFIGGLRLQVAAADEAAALEVLNQPVPESIALGDGEEFEQPHCPQCGSVEITFEGASRAAALTSLYIASLPMPPGPETWGCGACGARWKDAPDQTDAGH